MTLNKSVKITKRGNQEFGWIMVTALAVIFLWKGLRLKQWHPTAIILAAAFLFLTVFKPGLLTKPHRLWLALGDLISRVIQPLLLGLVFFLLLTPIGWLRRRLGYEKINVKPIKASTFWIAIESPSPIKEDDFRRQF